MRRKRLHLLLPLAVSCWALLVPLTTTAKQLFDGHIHYNQDEWDVISPSNALERLDRAGIGKAFVSSTPTEGTEKLYRLAPDRIIPVLRPYRSRADRRTWFDDTKLVARLEATIDSVPYRGIGEFHIFGANASTPVVGEVLELARQHGLFVHAHADEDAITRIVDRAPDLTVVWAHAGFDVDVARLGQLLDRYPNLLLELSFRNDIAPEGEITAAWRTILTRHPRRFLVGMDTYIASRWAELNDLADQSRHWLAQLPPDVADRIAFENASMLADQTTAPE